MSLNKVNKLSAKCLAAFMAVIHDPARLEAQKAHREQAILDTYTLIVRTTFDRIKESIEQQ